MDGHWYLEHFRVSTEMLRRLVQIALSHGGDYADLYFEHTIFNDITMRDGEVNSAGTHIDYGVGIRVLKGGRTGYAYAESTQWEDMAKAASAAALIALAASGESMNYSVTGAMAREIPAQMRYFQQDPLENHPAKDKLPFLKSLGDKVAASDSRVVKVLARIADSTSYIMMYNSFGELTCDTRPICSVTSSAIVRDSAGRSETCSASRSFRQGFEMLTDELVGQVAARTTRGIDERFAAVRPKGGEMPVVMGAGGSGILLHEAIGHTFEADFIRKRQSIFSEKLGQMVCDPSVTVVDDGTLPGNRGSVTYDDEGVPGQKTAMVTEGRLTSFLHDRISAAHFNVAPTGNGRRESFRFPPIPRMRSTYMENGKCSREDLIASVRHGLYVDDFSNGQVKIGEGDFTFYVKNGFIIENGRLTVPVKDINVIGNGPEALAGIRGVADDLEIDNGTWVCGKDQSCVVTCGIPTVLVESLTVGGEA